MEVVASLSQCRTAAAQCGLFTYESVPVIFDPPCNKPTRCNSGSIVFIDNFRYALHGSDALCVHHQEHYKL